ncbi:hypothetical protein U2F10_01340 [Leptothoe sp. EHU-05/26/07-4]
MPSASFNKRVARWHRLSHRWIAIAISIPMIFIIATGIFLQDHGELKTQVAAATGDVLQVAVRRTDWLEDVHEGKWHELNLWLFLPVHVLSLLLWLTGTVVAYNR